MPMPAGALSKSKPPYSVLEDGGRRLLKRISNFQCLSLGDCPLFSSRAKIRVAWGAGLARQTAIDIGKILPTEFVVASQIHFTDRRTIGRWLGRLPSIMESAAWIFCIPSVTATNPSIHITYICSLVLVSALA